MTTKNVSKKALKVAQNDPHEELKVFIANVVTDVVQSSVALLDEKIEESKRHMGILHEETQGHLQLIAENVTRLHERLDVIEFSLREVKRDVMELGAQVRILRTELDKRVDIEQYYTLEKKVIELEKQVRTLKSNEITKKKKKNK